MSVEVVLTACFEALGWLGTENRLAQLLCSAQGRYLAIRRQDQSCKLCNSQAWILFQEHWQTLQDFKYGNHTVEEVLFAAPWQIQLIWAQERH